MTNLDAMNLAPLVIMGWLGLSTVGTIGLILGAIAAGLGLFVAALPWIVQPFLRSMLFLRYNLKVIGRENIPRTGPVLLVSNHLSWFDGFFLAATLPRKGTALVNSGTFALPVVGYLARRCGLIPVPYQGPKAQRAAIEACRTVLDEGGLLGIFPEAQLSRTGMTGAFHRGLEVILAKREHVVVIPVYLDNVWGSVMSFSGGLFFRKWPKGWRRTVVISYGAPVVPPITVFRVRQAVLVSGVAARTALSFTPKRPEPIDLSLPHYDHPTLGPLTVSTADVHEPQYSLHQIGHKPGTVGHPLPGVAIRAIDETGTVLPEDVEGSIQALLPGRADWANLDRRGKIDRDGFLTLVEPTSP
jgi:1-acyl-sn-glycerol-3-phosphate acyltransferase